MILSWPVAKEYRRITQQFGENSDYYARYGLAGHEGVDIGCPTKTPVLAAHAGNTQILYASESYGLYIQILSANMMTLYAHLADVRVASGQKVEAGDVIGLSGDSGRSTGPHLHFGVCPLPRDWDNGFKGWVDPMPLLLGGKRKMQEALSVATAVRFEIEEIVRLFEAAEQHRRRAIDEQDMAEECEFEAKKRLAVLINRRDGRAYQVEGLLGGSLPEEWEK